MDPNGRGVAENGTILCNSYTALDQANAPDDFGIFFDGFIVNEAGTTGITELLDNNGVNVLTKVLRNGKQPVAGMPVMAKAKNAWAKVVTDGSVNLIMSSSEKPR